MGGQGEGLRLEPRASDAERCPYCRDALAAEPICACDACGTTLHARCRAEHGGCTTQGCAGAAPSRRASAAVNEAPLIRELYDVPATADSRTTPGQVAVRAKDEAEAIHAPVVVEATDVVTTSPGQVADALRIFLRGFAVILASVLAPGLLIALGYGIVVGGLTLVRDHDLPPVFEGVFIVAGVLSPAVLAIASHWLGKRFEKSGLE